MMPPPQPYPGMYYQPMAPEHLLSRRNVWTVNAIALIVIWLGMLLRLIAPLDANVLAAARFFVVTGALMGALGSTAGALGSKKTSDLQNIGLFVWAGFLILVAGLALSAMGL